MGTVLWILVVLVAVAGGVVIARRRGRDPASPPPRLTPADEQRAVHGDPRRLAPGDVVHLDDTDFLVEKTITFDEGGFTWSEHLLADAVTDRRLWLSVEEDDALELAVYERLVGADLEPVGADVTHDGVSYRRREKGQARWSAVSVSGPGESGAMEYADYAAGERILSFERYGSGAWEVSTGRLISEHALEVYPAR